MFQVTLTVHNAGTHTIWVKLAERLGREPTNAEVAVGHSDGDISDIFEVKP